MIGTSERRAALSRGQAYVLDTGRRETGSAADWVQRFDHVWAAPNKRLEALLALLDPNVVLKQPGRPAQTVGRDAARAYFRRALKAAPDLTAKTQRWRGEGAYLYLDILFSATLGAKHVVWNGIDRFVFADGVAVERTAFFEDSNVIVRSCLRHPKGWRQLLRLATGI